MSLLIIAILESLVLFCLYFLQSLDLLLYGDICGQAQNRQPVQRFDVDDVVNDVQHMSLESVEFDMTTGVTAEIPGYCFVPESDLLPGNFIDPSTFEEPPGLPSHFNFAADQNIDTCNQFEVGSFPADVDLWSQLDTRSDEAGTIDMNEFADLIHFQ